MMSGSQAELVKEAQMEQLRRDVLARGKTLCPYCGLALARTVYARTTSRR